MTTDHPSHACSHCGSLDLACGVEIGQHAEAGRIGLKYKDGVLFVGTEPLRADVCTACGHIERLFVKDPGHKWIT